MRVNNDRDLSSQWRCSVGKRAAHLFSCGFTMIELLVVLAIVALLLVVASPNYNSIISGSQVDESRLGLATSLALARTEAIKRGETIRVCAATPGDCSGTDWSMGWELLRPDDEVLQVVQHDSGDAQVSYDCGNFIAYSNSGARDGSAGSETCTFTISKNGIDKTLKINRVGRVRMD